MSHFFSALRRGEKEELGGGLLAGEVAFGTNDLSQLVVERLDYVGRVDDASHFSGTLRGYPLAVRRVTVAEERTLLNFAADSLTTGMEVCQELARERPGRFWPEQVLPYGLAGTMLISPTDWTLTESTRGVRLPRS